MKVGLLGAGRGGRLLDQGSRMDLGLSTAHPLASAGQPFVRLIQRRFAADSLRSMVEAVEGRGTDKARGRFIPPQLHP
jgi:hypothetical protein